MIKNYLKIAWRNLLKNKAHTFINVVGLSVGMAVTILIGLWIYDELSYDHCFQNHDQIVQVMQHQTINGNIGTQTSIPIPLGWALRKDYKSDFKYVVLSRGTEQRDISFGDKILSVKGNFMQAEAPYLLSLNMIKGSRAGLQDQSSIIINASLAKALFGDAEPINKVLKIDNKYSVKVTGVYEDLPRNTSFSEVTFISTWDLYMTTEPYLKRMVNYWGNNSWQIYAQMAPNVDIAKVSAKIHDIKLKIFQQDGDKLLRSFHPIIFLYPMNRWHLYSEFKNGINIGGPIQFVWMFGIIGVFVLLLACINFMNLSTARSEKRAKEVGIRKTVGSMRSQLIWQFLSESLMIAMFAFLLSLLIVQLVLPWFNQLADKTMSVFWANPLFWLLGISFSIITGLVAGSYPAFYLSSFQPVKVLKGTFKAGRFAAVPRKVLVVLQFTVSVTLIIGTLVVFRQVQYTKDRPIGYDRDGLIQAQINTPDVHNHFNALRYDLLQSGAITEIAESDSPVTEVWSNNSGLSWPGKDPNLQDDFATIPVMPEFGKTVGWKMLEGRNFSRDFLTDTNAVILNETSVKFMNLKRPVGQILIWGKNKYTIIGVVKDMVMSSPYEPVKTSLFFLLTGAGGMVNIKLNPKMSAHEAIEKIQTIFKRYDPASPFDYKFTDKEYAKKFDNEERVGQLAGFFTVLAIFISCLGLFGMASFMAEQRTKEIGVRKVLGASVFSLWRLMSTDFVVLVCISLLIAVPVAYYFMHGWLQNYQYQAPLSWWIFGITGVGAIVITLITVSFQSIKAALADPVKSLKNE